MNTFTWNWPHIIFVQCFLAAYKDVDNSKGLSAKDEEIDYLQSDNQDPEEISLERLTNFKRSSLAYPSEQISMSRGLFMNYVTLNAGGFLFT